MGLPDKLKIGALIYSVEESGELAEREVFGEHYPQSQKILINKAIPPDAKEVVLLHEIAEALVNNLEIEINHDHLTSFCFMLYQVIRDNGLFEREGI